MIALICNNSARYAITTPIKMNFPRFYKFEMVLQDSFA